MTAGFDNIVHLCQADKTQNFEVSMVLRNVFAFDINFELYFKICFTFTGQAVDLGIPQHR